LVAIEYKKNIVDWRNVFLDKKKRQRVVLIGYPWQTIDFEVKAFSQIGVEVVALDSANPASVLAGIREADIIIYDSAYPITAELLEAAPNCQAVIRNGVGVDSVDVNAATERGIIIANIVGHCTDEVADHALTLLLGCARNIVQGNNQTKRGEWDWRKYTSCHRLRGATLGIIGFGKIGRALAEKVKPLGMQCLIYDIMVVGDLMSTLGVKSVTLDELFTQSDFISIHASLTEKTYHLIGEKELRLMKKGAFIINTSRGMLIDEQALIKVLKEGRIAGAGLDVFEEEPPIPSNPLFSMDNVIVTPHYAFYSEEAIWELRQKVCDTGVRILTNQWPPSLINPEVQRNSRHKQRK
jgi:D-3-phosphoglycerate dehydrogenase / 2-oxoglutarate reductase